MKWKRIYIFYLKGKATVRKGFKVFGNGTKITIHTCHLSLLLPSEEKRWSYFSFSWPWCAFPLICHITQACVPSATQFCCVCFPRSLRKDITISKAFLGILQTYSRSSKKILPTRIHTSCIIPRPSQQHHVNITMEKDFCQTNNLLQIICLALVLILIFLH